MDVRQLGYVIAVAEELSFTRAAARLRIAQPPLSKQIRSVEQELGVSLFSRTKRVVRLTEAGKVFVFRARRVLQELQELKDATQRAGRGDAGRIVIGFVGSVAFHFFPRVLREYRAAVPDVDIELLELRNGPLMDALRNGRVDVAFMRPFFKDENIAMHPILEERLVAALPAAHRLAGRQRISVRELAAEPFVTPTRRPAPSGYAFIMGICERAGFQPKVVQEATDIQSVVGLVAAGMGVSIIPDSIKRLRIEGVKYCDLPDVKESGQIVVAWRRDDRSEVLKRFLALILAPRGDRPKNHVPESRHVG